MIEQTFLRFFRYLIDTDGKLPSDSSKIVYSSEIDDSFFHRFNVKDNLFAPSEFSHMWNLCRDYYVAYRAPISDTSLLMKVNSNTFEPAVVRGIEALVVDIRRYSAEPGQFEALREEIRNYYVRHRETSIYQKGMELAKEDPIAAAKYVQGGLSSLIRKTAINEDAEDQCMYLWQLMELQLKEFRDTGSIMPNSISYGFSDFDTALGGMYPGELIIVAGPPNVGKSFLTGEIAYSNALDHGKKVVFANREMLYRQVVNRFLARQTQVPSKKLRSGVMSDAERNLVESAMEEFVTTRNTNLFFMPPSKSFSCEAIKRYVEEAMGDTKPDLIVIDYLNELEPSKGRSEGFEKIGVICQELKNLAVEFRCPVISPTQPSSAGLETQNPSMKDIGYKIINQKADTIFFLTEDPECRYVAPLSDNEVGVPGQIFVKVIKARNDGKPAYPFRLQVEFATTSISQARYGTTGLGRSVEETYEYE